MTKTGLFDKIREMTGLSDTHQADTVPMEMDVADEMKGDDKRIQGKIIKISSEGYGFLSSKDIPFTRIFFHWSALRNDTLKFTELKSGMKVSFVAFDIEGKGYRAIKIKVESPSQREE